MRHRSRPRRCCCRASGGAAGCWLLPHRSTITLSLFWALMFAIALPRRGCRRGAAPTRLGIAVLDLGLVGRGRAEIRALLQLRQAADQGAYGAVLEARCRG